MELAIISDTHMPRGARQLPAACVKRLLRADLIVHAGDLMQLSVLRQLEVYGTVVAVQGNVDDLRLRQLLPLTRTIDLEEISIAVVHDAGPAQGRVQRLRRRFPGAGAVVFGHSHLPAHERAADGFQIFNPGSPTERRRSPHHTMGVAHVSGAEITFQLIALD